MSEAARQGLDGLLGIMDTLLGENGCPWDKEQTHQSLNPCLTEECQELLDAIDSGDVGALREELGDVLLQVVFHAKLAERAGAFNMDDVVGSLSEKLVRRHTHIFAGDKAATPEEAIELWNKNKKKERPHT